jgi:hypothetical protein
MKEKAPPWPRKLHAMSLLPVSSFPDVFLHLHLLRRGRRIFRNPRPSLSFSDFVLCCCSLFSIGTGCGGGREREERRAGAGSWTGEWAIAMEFF